MGCFDENSPFFFSPLETELIYAILCYLWSPKIAS